MTDALATTVIRPARNEDGDGLGRLIARCWADYPGSVYDPIGEHGDLPYVASNYEDAGGLLWVAVAEERIIGSVATAPAGVVGGAWELTKLYLAPGLRGGGLATLLVEMAEAHAAAHGAARMILWSDVLFTRAHRFYERLGYRRDGRTRELHDISQSSEYFFAKRLDDGPSG